MSGKEAWFLHSERGWLHVKLEGRIVKVDGLAEPKSLPYVSPLAAKQGFGSQCSTALSRGYAEVSADEVAAWRRTNDASPSPEMQAQRDADWRTIGHDPEKGFERLELRLDGAEAPDLLRLIADPRLEGLEDLRVRAWTEKAGLSDYSTWIAALSSRPLPRLRNLELDSLSSSDGARESRVGAIDGLLRLHPVLDTVVIMGTAWLDARVETPALRTLRIDGSSVEPRAASVLTNLGAPALVSLRLHPGYSGDTLGALQVEAFFQREDLSSLRQLELFGVEPEISLFEALSTTPMLRRLEGLTLQGGFGPRAAGELLEVIGSFDHLRRFGIDEEALTDELQDAFPKAFGTYG
ncbi:MAG: hypothetical protein H6721_22725 [Sandaracinus sp.]|nr:hypothetical protein [Sandaracinus sp.]MCB9615382.1 hypothetical protein [Sandaracinus sp.]MCB9619510.1 hypothetical protein [Sandaracinus sp.]MCB9634948.1 hypothetical protein [Sandaracinus sp.]